MIFQSEYSQLSDIYDIFTDGFDYDKYLAKIFASAPLPESGLALDCGCGTGTLLLRLSQMGYSCTGVDISPEMLAQAQTKLSDAGFEAHLVCQPLQKIDLYGAYDAAFCSLDTINHLTNKRDVTSFIKRMYNFIEPGGYFVFDAKTAASFEKTSGVRCYEHDDVTLIIRGDFDGNMAYYDITAFEPAEKGLYRQTLTQIEERCYETRALTAAVRHAGFDVCKRFAYAGRNVWICRKNGDAR